MTPARTPPIAARRAAPIPQPRPLSPRARAYVDQVTAEARERQQAIERAVALAKADKSDQVAVYDADGNLVGVCDEDSITPLAPAKAPNAPDAPPTDLAPAPASEVGTPADAVPAAKAMSLGARGQHQLGGAQPRGGVPTVPAEDAEEDAEVAKARVQVLSANLKKSLNGGNGASAAEANRVADAMNQAAIAKFAELRQRGIFPGLTRRG